MLRSQYHDPRNNPTDTIFPENPTCLMNGHQERQLRFKSCHFAKDFVGANVRKSMCERFGRQMENRRADSERLKSLKVFALYLGYVNCFCIDLSSESCVVDDEAETKVTSTKNERSSIASIVFFLLPLMIRQARKVIRWIFDTRQKNRL